MPKITVITPSVRPQGLTIVDRALARQTFDSFEWLVVSPIPYISLFNDRFKHIREPEKEEGDYWTVYKAYNAALREAQGELIVSIQDHTSFDPDGLSKFWYHYSNAKNQIVSGVGNKYSDPSFKVKTWQDPRERNDVGSFYECFPNDIEWNYSAVPRDAIYAVGGFDEYFDKYSSLCGLDVSVRLEILGGYKFFLDQTNKSYSLEHGRLPDWESRLPFEKAWPDRIKEYQKNPVLNYLR